MVYVLREPLRQLLPNEQKFIRMFDLFEYLLGLVHLDLKLQTIEGEEMLSAPIGSFAWRQNRQWIDQEDLNWNPIIKTFFENPNRLKKAKEKFDQIVGQYRDNWI